MNLKEIILNVLSEDEIKITKPIYVKNPLAQPPAGYENKVKGFKRNFFDDFRRTHKPDFLLDLLKSAEARPHVSFKLKDKWVKGIYVKYELYNLFFNPNMKTDQFINYPRYKNGMIPKIQEFVYQIAHNKEKYPMLLNNPYKWYKVLHRMNKENAEASNWKDRM